MQIKLSNKDQGIFVFQLDKNNYIKFCPERGGVITNWISDGNEILYFDKKRFIDKTKSIRGGIPILFPICGNLNTSSSIFGNGYLQLPQHGFARDLQWQYSFNENFLYRFLFFGVFIHGSFPPQRSNNGAFSFANSLSNGKP